MRMEPILLALPIFVDKHPKKVDLLIFRRNAIYYLELTCEIQNIYGTSLVCVWYLEKWQEIQMGFTRYTTTSTPEKSHLDFLLNSHRYLEISSETIHQKAGAKM